MLDKQLLTQTVEEALAGTEMFLVDITAAPDNTVTVTVDSPNGMDIESCVKLTRAIEARFDREVEDYELQVQSAGLTTPFSVPQQYRMNVGNPVEVLTRDGRKLRGTLTRVNDDCTEITVAVPTKVKEEGAKRPILKDVEHNIAVADIKSIVREIVF